MTNNEAKWKNRNGRIGWTKIKGKTRNKRRIKTNKNKNGQKKWDLRCLMPSELEEFYELSAAVKKKSKEVAVLSKEDIKYLSGELKQMEVKSTPWQISKSQVIHVILTTFDII